MLSVYFILTALVNLDAKFSLEIHDVYLDFIKFMIERVYSHIELF